jgi:hypothetical protein
MSDQSIDIRYLKRESQFLEPCEQAIKHWRESLLAGEPLRINLNTEKRGYERRIVVHIRAGDRGGFGTDWAGDDPTRFPQRIRAAATALYNCACAGWYLIEHREGVIDITKISGSPSPEKDNSSN